jgi:plastocyanin
MRCWRRRVLTCAAVMGLAASASAADTELTVRLFQFQPAEVSVTPGSRVVWTNQDDIKHTVTSGLPGRPDGRFNLALAGKGATAAHRFAEAGVHRYFCERHENMRGEIRVGPQ